MSYWGRDGGISQTVHIKRDIGFSGEKFLNPLSEMIQFKKMLCKYRYGELYKFTKRFCTFLLVCSKFKEAVNLLAGEYN